MTKIHKNRSKILWVWGGIVCVFLLSIAFCPLASATGITYTYTGNAFTNFGGNYSCAGGVGECAVSLSFTVATAFGGNTPFGGFSPISFTFSDGTNMLTQTNAQASFFELSTGPSGAIYQWAIFACDYSIDVCIDTFNDPGGLSPYGPGVGDSSPGNPALSDYASNSNNPGTWSTPEPSSILLLGAALLGLFGTRRRWHIPPSRITT
jgi:hypothetical protein